MGLHSDNFSPTQLVITVSGLRNIVMYQHLSKGNLNKVTHGFN